VDKADVIGVGWVPPPGPLVKTAEGTPARLVDARVKWSVKGDVNHPIPALLPEPPKDDPGPTTAPAPTRYDSTDKILFFVHGSARVPLLFKMVPATPRRMRLLRDQLGMMPGTAPVNSTGTKLP